MRRDRLAAAAVLALVAGAMLWYERRAEGAPAEVGGIAGLPAVDFSALSELLSAPTFARIQSTVASAAEDVLRMIAPVGAWSPPERAAPYLSAIYAAEDRYSIPRNLFARQLDIESDHFAPDVISGARLSSAGAIGIAQFMPATAAEYGVDPRDPWQSIEGGAHYMRWLYDATGTWAGALTAYNWGIGNVRRKGADAAPAETRTYVKAILGDVGLTG